MYIEYVLISFHITGPAEPPAELMCVAEYMVPRIILRLIQHLRISVPSNAQMDPEEQLQNCEQVSFKTVPVPD